MRTISQACCGLASALSLTTSLAASGPTCVDRFYDGFDSRLTVEVAGRAPIGDDRVVGFEIFRGRPVVGLPHRIVAIDGARALAHPSLDTITGLAIDAAGGVWVQAGTAVRRFGDDRLVDAGELSAGRRLHNSGSPAFAVSHSGAHVSRIAIQSVDGSPAAPLDFEGELRTMSWNSAGLAAVIGHSLVTWDPAQGSLTRLGADQAFRSARDVVLIGQDRAVVALSNVVLLVTGTNRLVLAAIRGRVRWQAGALYVLDERTGIAWVLRGLEAAGSRTADAAHAAKLLRDLKPGASETEPAFLEAVRILGCQAARELRTAAGGQSTRAGKRE